MTTYRISRRALVAAALFSFAGVASSAQGHEISKGAITIEHPWARINIGDRPSAAYAKIHNDGATADRLVAASSPAFGRIEIHNHIMEGGVMRMRKIEGIVAPAKGVVELAPGGYHLMLFEPTKPVKKGDLIDLTLVFEGAGEIEATAIAEGLASGSHSGGHGASHGGAAGATDAGAHKMDHGAHKHGESQ